MSRMLLASYTLWNRELVRFYRQPSRVVGALASPFMFWILLGSGIGKSFQSSDPSSHQGYLSYFFPGTLLLVLFFTAVFSTISIIEDRREGFLQSVLVSPAPRFCVVLGKVLGGSSLAFLQAFLFLLVTPWLGIHLGIIQGLVLAGVLFLNAFLMTTLGFLIAWRFKSIQGFHAVMNLLLMPMWILSGALFPAEGASVWIRWIMKINPLSYGLQTIRSGLFQYEPHPGSYVASLLMTIIFSIGLFILATLSASENQGQHTV